jgi:malate synthase
VTADLFKQVLADEMDQLRSVLGAENFDKGRFSDAIRLFSEMSLANDCAEFLTLPAYELL